MLDLLYTLHFAVLGCLPVDRPLRLDVGKLTLALSPWEDEEQFAPLVNLHSMVPYLREATP